MSKYMWVMKTNSGNLIHQIDKDGNNIPFSIVSEHEKRDELDMLFLSNENKTYAVDLRSGYFYIDDLPFYPCAEILDVSISANKDLAFLNKQRLEEMTKLSKLIRFENKENIDQLSERQLRKYNTIKTKILKIETELTGLKYRIIYFRRPRKERTINIDTTTGEIISSNEGKQFLYGYLIGWQTTFFGKNYQRFMFISELYDEVFEIRSKR